MTDIASAIKSEIVRLARKEGRAQIEPLKKAIAQLRGQQTSLRDEITTLRGEVRRLTKITKHLDVTPARESTDSPRLRFTAKGLITLRKKFDVSVDDMGLLMHCSGQSVRKWEDGTSFPREPAQQAYFELRGIGKREALARLEGIKQAKA